MRDRCLWLLAREAEDTDPLSFVVSERQGSFFVLATHTRDKPRCKLFTSKNFPKTKDDSCKILTFRPDDGHLFLFTRTICVIRI
jgi:hypothetical protein